MFMKALIIITAVAISWGEEEAAQQDTRLYFSNPGTTFGQVGVSSSNGALFGIPGQGLVDQLNQIISNHGGRPVGSGSYPGHGGHNGYPGHGGHPGQGGFPVGGGAGGVYPGQGGFPVGGGGGGVYPGQGSFPVGGGVHPGTGGFPGQGGYPGQGGIPGHGGGYPGQGSSSTCKYWCKTPEGQAYCCETANHNTRPTPPPNRRPGFCPPVRPQCPPTRFGGPPITCAHDSACPNYRDKCCYDRCLGEHVCKTPSNPGIYGR